MSIPISFPDWVPWWVQLLTVVLAILLGLAFLFMPFSVFGVKSRLEAVEARLDEIQGEIRTLALRLPEPSRGRGYDDEPLLHRAPDADRELRARPPIPPAAWETQRGRAEPARDRVEAPRDRAEPRLGPR